MVAAYRTIICGLPTSGFNRIVSQFLLKKKIGNQNYVSRYGLIKIQVGIQMFVKLQVDT